VVAYSPSDPETTGDMLFYLDIRPAIDMPTAAVERMIRGGGDVWCKAGGAAIREREQQKWRREKVDRL
jgi:cytochrome c heme-lyase